MSSGEMLQEPVEQVLLNLTVGQIPVTFTYDGDEPDVLWMQQKEATFRQQFDPRDMAEVLGLRPADLDERFPVEEVFTGLPHIVVPLKTLESVRRIQVAREEYFALIEQQRAKSILVFCPESYEAQNQVNVPSLPSTTMSRKTQAPGVGMNVWLDIWLSTATGRVTRSTCAPNKTMKSTARRSSSERRRAIDRLLLPLAGRSYQLLGENLFSRKD